MVYSQQGYNILIVDDHQVIIDGLTEILKEEKIIGSIQSAINGQEGIEKVMSSSIDCVLMDINMPLVNGYEATKIIKEQKPHIKVIIVSMLSDTSAILKLLRTGADAFVTKDTAKDELLKTITKVMLNEKYISGELNLCNHPEIHKNSQSAILHLTPREKEIIRYIADGLSNPQIAEKLFVSTATVNTHRKNILAKLELKSTAAIVKYAAENNLL